MIRGYDNTDSAFQAELRAMAARHGWNADAIAAVMAVETGGTFSPSIRNKVSGATGLIQFMPNTARSLGTTVEILASLSAVDQLPYVERYFAQVLGGRTPDRRVDYYLAVFWPAGIGASMSTPIICAPSAAYEQNKDAFDPERKGYIAPADLDARLAAVMGEQVQKKKHPVTGQEH